MHYGYSMMSLWYELRLSYTGNRYDGIAGMLRITFISIRYVMLTFTILGLMYRYVMVPHVRMCYGLPIMWFLYDKITSTVSGLI